MMAETVAAGVSRLPACNRSRPRTQDDASTFATSTAEERKLRDPIGRGRVLRSVDEGTRHVFTCAPRLPMYLVPVDTMRLGNGCMMGDE